MTWTEIYNKVVFSIFGESTPAPGMITALQGQNGIIANAHQKIQQDYNYWFMEAASTISLVAGTQNYALPTGFKEIYPRGLRLLDSSTGDYHLPLSPLLPGEPYETFRDPSQQDDYPLWYEIFGGQVYLYPTPDLSAVVLAIRYYAYLARPPVAFANWGVVDDLTTYGCNAVVALAASEVCKINEEYQKQQAFLADVSTEIEILQKLDKQMRRSELTECRYRGF